MAEQPQEPLQPENLVASSISAVALKIPLFWLVDPAVFAQVEFACSGVNQQKTCFDHVIAALAPEVITEVRDLILNPPGDHPYDQLKQAVIKKTEDSEQQ